MKRDAPNDNRKNSKTEKPTNDYVFECVHCRVAFLEYEASDAAKRFQSRKAEKLRGKLE